MIRNWFDWFTQPVVELIEWRTPESEVSGSDTRARFLLLEQKPVLYHEWLGWWRPILYTVKWSEKSLKVESSTWRLNSHNCPENYTKTKKKYFNFQVATGIVRRMHMDEFRGSGWTARWNNANWNNINWVRIGYAQWPIESESLSSLVQEVTND